MRRPQVGDGPDVGAVGGVEAGHDGEGRARAVVDHAHRPVGADAVGHAVEHDHLAVEVLEGAEAEVAVLAHHPHRDGPLVQALDQGAGRRDLVERVRLDAEQVAQGPVHEHGHRRPAGPGVPAQRLPDAVIEVDAQFRHQWEMLSRSSLRMCSITATATTTASTNAASSPSATSTP